MKILIHLHLIFYLKSKMRQILDKDSLTFFFFFNRPRNFQGLLFLLKILFPMFSNNVFFFQMSVIGAIVHGLFEE